MCCGVIEDAYDIADWGDNPYTPRGREIFTNAIREFKKLIRHPWFRDVLR